MEMHHTNEGSSEVLNQKKAAIHVLDSVFFVSTNDKSDSYGTPRYACGPQTNDQRIQAFVAERRHRFLLRNKLVYRWSADKIEGV